jgi:hypothetical protein
MMEPNPQRPARKVGIADRLWDTFEAMAESMGSDRDALINQAMFMFARLNGFLEAGPHSTGRASGGPRSASVLSPIKGARRDGASVSNLAHRDSEDKINHKSEEDPSRREVAERVLETAAELERLIKGKNSSSAMDASRENHGAAESGLGEAEAADVSSDMHEDEAQEEANLYLMSEGGEMDKVGKDRFVIGRGKHCDFIINSGKVSREHAVIVRDGMNYFIEDLGSSNGTWFNKQRIKRRRVEDGDEYYICSEKVKLVMR